MSEDETVEGSEPLRARAASVPIFIISSSDDDDTHHSLSPPSLFSVAGLLNPDQKSHHTLRRTESLSLPSRIPPRLPSIPEVDESNTAALEENLLASTLAQAEPRKKPPVFLAAMGRVSTRNRLRQEQEEQEKKEEEDEKEDAVSQDRRSSDEAPVAESHDELADHTDTADAPSEHPLHEPTSKDFLDTDRIKALKKQIAILPRRSSDTKLLPSLRTTRANGWIETDL
jgi:hypothetical protein